MILKSVGVLSLGKITGLLYAGLGLFIGFFFTMFALLGATMGALAEEEMGALFSVFFGMGSIVIFPLLYGIMGLVMGVIVAALYNLLARLVGGVEVELE
jgi:hypothetical protein